MTTEDQFEPVMIPFLGRRCRFLFEEQPDDPKVRVAIERILEPACKLLDAAEPFVVEYCKDILALYPKGEGPPVNLEKPGDVWSYVQFGKEFNVTRRTQGDSDDGIYFSMECNCDWEPEHGLQLVIRNGTSIAKVGSFDGHLTNADAFADPSLVGVVYVSTRRARDMLLARHS
jgi:hypothetical protein